VVTPLFNVTAGYQINPEWSVKGRVNNVFDKPYELVRTTTPQAQFVVGVQYQAVNITPKKGFG